MLNNINHSENLDTCLVCNKLTVKQNLIEGVCSTKCQQILIKQLKKTIATDEQQIIKLKKQLSYLILDDVVIDALKFSTLSKEYNTLYLLKASSESLLRKLEKLNIH